jgi:hypothetical protein
MATTASAAPKRRARVHPRRLARWAGDRLRDAVRRASWHASRLRMQMHDAVVRSRKLPPGSLTATAAHDAETDDRFYLEQFHRHGPIFKLFWGSGHLKICVVGFPLARRLLNQHRGALRTETTEPAASFAISIRRDPAAAAV